MTVLQQFGQDAGRTVEDGIMVALGERLNAVGGPLYDMTQAALLSE